MVDLSEPVHARRNGSASNGIPKTNDKTIARACRESICCLRPANILRAVRELGRNVLTTKWRISLWVKDPTKDVNRFGYVGGNRSSDEASPGNTITPNWLSVNIMLNVARSF